VVYTGTHDNDTTLGWFNSAPESEREFCLRYLGRDGSDIVWDMIRAVWASVAMFALAPMQDLLVLGTEARMNYPGRPGGNWSWRMPSDATRHSGIRAGMNQFNFLYGRSPKKEKKAAAETEAASQQ
jgi:4-alpha-glucanotransferase